jgi:superoxide dismutase
LAGNNPASCREKNSPTPETTGLPIACLIIENHCQVHEEKALLACDVCEHDYYIDYRNARPKYVE